MHWWSCSSPVPMCCDVSTEEIQGLPEAVHDKTCLARRPSLLWDEVEVGARRIAGACTPV